ncbi:hypothetical protein HDU81_002521 [Chytriomyces hyalinus]|nr:hypothetical protein HDU81_002521 [Chytriomyces hyalinus]
MPFSKRSESPAAVLSRDQDSNANDALAREREKRDRANRPRTSSFKQSSPNALNQPQPVLFNRGTGTTLTSISIDDFVTHGSSPNTSSNSRAAHLPDPFSFAKTMRIDSKEFMDFWKFTQSEQTIRNLIFYKEFCYLEDNLAAQTACRSPEQSSLFTRARQAGITQPILRFLIPSSSKAAVGSRDLIHSIPRIPVTEIPQELKHAYETLIHSYVLSQPPNEINGISKEMRNALFIKVAGDSELGGLKTDALDVYVDAVVHYLYEEVFSRYVQSGSAAAAAAADTVGQISMAFGLNHTRAASAASFHTNRKGTPSVSAGPHSQGGSGTRIMLEASFQDIHMFWEPYNGGAYVSGARRSSDQGSDDLASSSPIKKFSSEAPASMRDIVGGLSMTPSSGVMLYTKPMRDGKQFDILMDISGFMERKDPDPVVLEYSRFCFVKVMDPNSVAYRDFSTFARLHKCSNHISFYEKTVSFDDDMAAQTAALTPQDAIMYTRARDEFGITQSLSRFMQNTTASDASKNRFSQLPPLPRIPVHPIPEVLKPAVVDMYGTFIGRNSAQEITFTNPPRRPAIQSALQQDFMRPIESDLLDACADDVLEMLYVNVFRDFVAENSGGKSTHGARLMDPVFGTPASGRAKEKDMALPSVTGGKLMRRGNSQKSEKASSGGGFLASLFKGKKKSAGAADAAEAATAAAAAAKSSTSVFSSDMKRALSPGPASFMLYEISTASKYDQPVNAHENLALVFTPAAFVHLMISKGTLHHQFCKFTLGDLSAGDMRLYSAVISLEDKLACQTQARSGDEARAYRAARLQGMTHALNRFMRISLLNGSANMADFSKLTSLPLILPCPVPESLKADYLEIFSAYISGSSTVEVSLSSVARRSAQIEIEQDFLEPVKTNVFDSCMDEIVESLYKGAFYRFISLRGGGGAVNSPVAAAAAATPEIGGLKLKPYGKRASTDSSFSFDMGISKISGRTESPLPSPYNMGTLKGSLKEPATAFGFGSISQENLSIPAAENPVRLASNSFDKAPSPLSVVSMARASTLGALQIQRSMGAQPELRSPLSASATMSPILHTPTNPRVLPTPFAPSARGVAMTPVKAKSLQSKRSHKELVI